MIVLKILELCCVIYGIYEMGALMERFKTQRKVNRIQQEYYDVQQKYYHAKTELLYYLEKDRIRYDYGKTEEPEGSEMPQHSGGSTEKAQISNEMLVMQKINPEETRY